MRTGRRSSYRRVQGGDESLRHVEVFAKDRLTNVIFKLTVGVLMNGWFGYAIGELGYPISSEKEEREETEDSSHELEILEEK